ncbi:MAG: DUF3299 domain-containing protein [Gemmataceae bacterium]|nr:DUF3299 domain-containing protein [Gemmataceae bacterium]MCI0741742.1 DUF3299 domain-containing protein [Gemmataceae bacterium]
MHRAFCVCLVLLAVRQSAEAGLYYSGENFAELPAQWRGFLLDQRTLRNIAQKPTPQNPASPARLRYEEEAAKLEKQSRERALTADEIADLGALYVRLGETGKALTVLRQAERRHPNHFRLIANLGTAWQLHGDLTQAALALEQAVRLAPGKFLQAEQFHLKLVRLRMKNSGGLDDLFGVRFQNDKGDYEPGKLADAEAKKLPVKAVAVAQQLALWLPADGLLLWQLAELANAHGDVKNAAAMLDGCVLQFQMNHAELRRHRQLVRAAADELPKTAVGAKEPHETKHAGTIAFRSKRPLISKLDTTPLPPISDTGVNALPWDLLGETAVDAKFRPTFARYLRELDGKQVSLTGFMQPLRDDLELGSFLFLEYPVGCWYCEMPDTTQIVFVELPLGKTTAYQRGLVRIVGRLSLNDTDPEDFFFAMREARVAGVD